MRFTHGTSAPRPLSGRTTPPDAGRRLRTPIGPRAPPRASRPTPGHPHGPSAPRPVSGRTTPPGTGRQRRLRTSTGPRTSPRRSAPPSTRAPQHSTQQPNGQSRQAPDADAASALPRVRARRRMRARQPTPGHPHEPSAPRPASGRTTPPGARRQRLLRTPTGPRTPPRRNAPTIPGRPSTAPALRPATEQTTPSRAGRQRRHRTPTSPRTPPRASAPADTRSSILTSPRHLARHPGVRSRRVPGADVAAGLYTRHGDGVVLPLVRIDDVEASADTGVLLGTVRSHEDMGAAGAGGPAAFRRRVRRTSAETRSPLMATPPQPPGRPALPESAAHRVPDVPRADRTTRPTSV
ncbi:hypothetical protein SAMN05216489_03134 [Streptomyces sp. 3213]|nr:hypothetical protein SAMN05216489_03134 [Streptomyces sp. 3213] [Streptomyces sp. 3213.3]